MSVIGEVYGIVMVAGICRLWRFEISECQVREAERTVDLVQGRGKRGLKYSINREAFEEFFWEVGYDGMLMHGGSPALFLRPCVSYEW